MSIESQILVGRMVDALLSIGRKPVTVTLPAGTAVEFAQTTKLMDSAVIVAHGDGQVEVVGAMPDGGEGHLPD